MLLGVVELAEEAAFWSEELVVLLVVELLLVVEAAFWSVLGAVLVPCAGGFTGALALSPWPGA